MLPARSRVRSGVEHVLVSRRGRRARRGPLTVHLYLSGSPDSPRAGFVVGRGVGPAVVRNRVRRRLRELVRTRLTSLPAGSLLVVRAQPESASASFAELGLALDEGLAAVSRPRRTGRIEPAGAGARS